jgi:RNA polymerase sigma-70 factor (ECF subfamily)
MGDLQKPRSNGTAMTPSARDADQDALYTRVAAEFGPPLARLAGAYESDSSRRQDLLQELHFAVWRSLATFRNQCSLRTWVYRVAHNTATTYVRKQRRSRRIRLASLEDLDESVQEHDVERMVDETHVRRKIKDLIRQLKPVDRDVLVLYLEGLKAAEIAEVVGISPGNVTQKVHRAQKYLRAHFQSGESHERDQ